MNENNNGMSEINTYYRKVDVIAAWEQVNGIPYGERLTYWFGDYGMDAPKYEHRDEIAGMYERIIAQGHPLLDINPAVYRQSEQYAHAHGEADAFHASARQNIACATAIDTVLAEGVDGVGLRKAAVDLIAGYGPGRIAWVLASAIRERRYDGQFSYDHRQWAQAFPIPIEYKPSYALQASTPVLNGFAAAALREFYELGCLHSGALQKHAGADKPSVMDQLRDARKNPAPPTPKSELDRGVPEHEI